MIVLIQFLNIVTTLAQEKIKYLQKIDKNL